MKISYEEIRCSKVAAPEVIVRTGEMCLKWDQKYGYVGKNYSNNKEYQLQLLVNSNEAELVYLALLNTCESFVDRLNALLAAIGCSKRVIFGGYTSNSVEKDPDDFSGDEENPDRKGWIDIVLKPELLEQYKDNLNNVVTSIEIKNTASYSKRKPSSFHQADVVLVTEQDTLKMIFKYSPIMNPAIRSDLDYKDAGEIMMPSIFRFKRVMKNTWQITDF